MEDGKWSSKRTKVRLAFPEDIPFIKGLVRQFEHMGMVLDILPTTDYQKWFDEIYLPKFPLIGIYIIEDKETEVPIGTFTYVIVAGIATLLELGNFAMVKEYQLQGFASETAPFIKHLAFEVLGCDGIIARVLPGNKPAFIADIKAGALQMSPPLITVVLTKKKYLEELNE